MKFIIQWIKKEGYKMWTNQYYFNNLNEKLNPLHENFYTVIKKVVRFTDWVKSSIFLDDNDIVFDLIFYGPATSFWSTESLSHIDIWMLDSVSLRQLENIQYDMTDCIESENQLRFQYRKLMSDMSSFGDRLIYLLRAELQAQYSEYLKYIEFSSRGDTKYILSNETKRFRIFEESFIEDHPEIEEQVLELQKNWCNFVRSLLEKTI